MRRLICSVFLMDMEVKSIHNIGKEVAQYVQNHFTEEFLKSKCYKSNQYKQALVDTFLKIDELLVTPQGVAELKVEAKKAKEEDEKINKNSNKQDPLRNLAYGSKEDDIAMYTGCTSCVVLVENNRIICANAGDSRAVLCKKGKAYPLSIDHKPELDTERNRIYKAQGWVSDGRVKGIL